MTAARSLQRSRRRARERLRYPSYTTSRDTTRGIQIEAKDEIRARLGRSPGKGDAVVMALSEGERAVRQSATSGRRPQVLLGYGYAKRR